MCKSGSETRLGNIKPHTPLVNLGIGVRGRRKDVIFFYLRVLEHEFAHELLRRVKTKICIQTFFLDFRFLDFLSFFSHHRKKHGGKKRSIFSQHALHTSSNLRSLAPRTRLPALSSVSKSKNVSSHGVLGACNNLRSSCILSD
jgi:hypothetical protein